MPVCRVLHAQSCWTLCYPIDCSQLGSSVYWVIQKKYRNGLPFPTPRDLPGPGIRLASPVSPALAGRFFITAPPGKLDGRA